MNGIKPRTGGSNHFPIFSTGKNRAPATGLCDRNEKRNILIHIAFMLLVLATATSARADNWPQFRGNLQLTGVASSVPPADLKVLWTYECGDTVESSAAVADGVVYVGCGDGKLTALDLADGKLKWRYSTGDLIGESSPAVSGGVVYVGDLMGLLHAVDAATGEKLWTYETHSEIKSSPTIYEGKVLIGSYDESLHAVDAKTGKAVWKFQTLGPVHGTPGVMDGVTYVAGCDENFRAIRVADGTEIFAIESGAYTGASAVLANGKAYYGTFSNEVLAVDLKQRKIVWAYEHAKRSFPYYSSAALKGDRLVVGGRDKMVHCLSASTGKELWTYMTRGRVESSPAIADERIYIGSSDGRLYVLDLNTGEKLWEFHAGEAIVASPAIADSRIVIGATDGVLYCLGEQTTPQP